MEYGKFIDNVRALDEAARTAEVKRLRRLVDTVEPATDQEAARFLLTSLDDALGRPVPVLSEAPTTRPGPRRSAGSRPASTAQKAKWDGAIAYRDDVTATLREMFDNAGRTPSDADLARYRDAVGVVA